MIRKISFAAVAVATLAIASPSFAQTFSSSTSSVSGSGTVRLRQTTTVNCNVSVTASPVGATSAPIPTRSISAGDFLCIAVVPYSSWSAAVDPGSTTTIQLTIGANTVASQPCYGTVIADWDNTTHRATFNNDVLPAVNPAHPSCTIISGYITIPDLTIL